MVRELRRRIRAGQVDGFIGVTWKHTASGGVQMTVVSSGERSALEGLSQVAMLDYAKARIWDEVLHPDDE